MAQYLAYIGGLVVLLLVFGSGYWLRDVGAQTEINSLVKDHEISLQEIEVVRTENTNLISALADSDGRREVLLDEIASLKSAPAEIRYLTKIETVISGGEIETTELPNSHTFTLEPGLPVAQFTVEPGLQPTYTFTTPDLTLRADLIIGEQDSAISLRAESSLNPGVEYELPVGEFNVKHIRERKFIEPNLLVGVGLSAGPDANQIIRPQAHIGGSFIHPTNDSWDFAQVRIGMGGDVIQIGFDPVLFNAGTRLPYLTNIWIGAGPSFGTNGEWAGTITLGAKL